MLYDCIGASRILFMRFDLADCLRHRSHGAVYTPGARLKENHRYKSKQRGCQHHAIKSEGILRHPRRDDRAVICPMPRKLERPKKRYDLL